MAGIKLKTLPHFPANLIGGVGLVVSKANGIYTVDLNYAELQEAAIGSAANDYVVIWDSVSKQFFRIKLSDMGSIVGAVSSVFGRAGAVVAQANDYTFAQIGSKPSTLGGYGITDAVNKAGDTMTGTLTMNGGSLKSITSAAVAPHFDTASAPAFNVAAGAANTTVGANPLGMVLIVEQTVSGHAALYLCTGGVIATFIGGTTGGIFVVPNAATPTPSAGQTTMGIAGGNWGIYHNQAQIRSYRVTTFKF